MHKNIGGGTCWEGEGQREAEGKRNLFNDAVNCEDYRSSELDWRKVSGFGGKWNDTDRRTPKY
jgi:hypothetical protein